jgi:hypothetical protein
MRLIVMVSPSIARRRRDFVSRDGIRGQGIILDLFPNNDEMFAGYRPSECGRPTTRMAYFRRIGGVPKDFVNFVFGDPMLRDVLHVAFGIIIQIPPNTLNVGHCDSPPC